MKRSSRRGRKRRGGRAFLWIAAAAAVCLCAAAFLSAAFVHVRRAEVAVRGLPLAFSGTVIVYASDICAGAPFGASESAELLRKVVPEDCGMLVLGGDYAYSARADGAQARELFSALNGIETAYGVYAVTGERDGRDPLLREYMGYAGVRCLDDSAVRIEKDGSSIVLAGFGTGGEYPLNPDGIFRGLDRDDTVICALHDPSALPALLSGSSSASAPRCALVLTGHTHGGQVRLFGRSLLPLPEGWEPGVRTEGGTVVVRSSGLGCETVPVRLGTRSEVYIITLISS